MHRVIACRGEPGHSLWMRFDDGVEGRFCFRNLLELERFQSLRDPRLFCTARASDDGITVWWPQAGIRLAVGILYQDLEARGGVRATMAYAVKRARADEAFRRFMMLATGRPRR